MKFSDIFKKGFAQPDQSDIIEGGLAIDVKGKRAYSKSDDTSIFQIGLDEEQVNALIDTFTGVPPIGTIVAFAGAQSTVPVGWFLCDGNNGTPDLRDTFIMGTSTFLTGPVVTGGSADAVVVSHTHKLPQHAHNATAANAGGHNHTYSRRNTSVGGVGIDGIGWQNFYETKATSWAGAHSHVLTINNSPAGTTTIADAQDDIVEATDANLPPYAKLVYIMRKS